MNGTCTGTIFWVPAPWGLGEGSKIKFLNMVMWHNKLKGMGSIPEYTDNFLIYNQTGNLGMGSKCHLPLDFFESVGICDGASSNVF